MSTLNTIYKLSNNPHTGAIGLEIETEAEEFYIVPEEMIPYWAIHNDGSLRDHGVEYVFLRPYNFFDDNYTKAMECFKKLTKTVPFKHSIYSSVHVHFNMLNYEVVHIMNFIALYFLFEEVLTRYCGPDREGNLFCLKTSNAEMIYMSANALAQSYFSTGFRQGIRTLNTGTLKYGGLNLSSLKNLGSLEVRTHPGTTDVEAINRWVSILNKIYTASKLFKNPASILQAFREEGTVSFLQNIFLEDTYHLDVDYYVNSIRNPLWYLSSFVNSVPTWENYGINDVSATKVTTKSRFKKTNLQPGSILFVEDNNSSFFTKNAQYFNDIQTFLTENGSAQTYETIGDE